MVKEPQINKYRDEIYTCVRSRCGFCFSSCPIFLIKGLETYTSRGKSMIIKAYLEGKIEFSQELLERFSQCTNCGFCTTNCDVDRPEIFNVFKNDMINAGFRINEHQRICDNITRQGNPYGDNATVVPTKYMEKIRPGSDLLFFAGCTARYRETSILHSMMEILGEFDFLKEAVCCGSVMLRAGNTDEAIVQALKLKEILDKYETVVTACAGCYNMIVEQYPKLGIDVRPKILHSSQYIKNLLDEGRIHLSKIGAGTKATYHDPCHIGRMTGIFEDPRAIIRAMGFELTEMPRNREGALCCGAGGGYKAIDGESAKRIANERSAEAKGTGSGLLITACPFCVRNLKDGSVGMDINVVDIVELVAQAIYRPDAI